MQEGLRGTWSGFLNKRPRDQTGTGPSVGVARDAVADWGQPLDRFKQCS